MTPALENLPAYIAQADKYSAEGKIAPTSNLAASKVYIFHGSLDIVVQQGSGKKLKEMYDHYGADVHAEFSIASGHGQVNKYVNSRRNLIQQSFPEIFKNFCQFNLNFDLPILTAS